MINIPLFRAKKIDSDEYVCGFLLNNMIITGYELKQERDGIYWHSISSTRINPTTIAIHFPDMLDSQGNKIFASLSEDGKGGDIFLATDGTHKVTAIYLNTYFQFRYFTNNKMGARLSISPLKLKVIGIQE